MNKKRILLSIASTILMMLFMVVPNQSKAAVPTTPVYFGVSLIRENSSTNEYAGKDAGSNIGYALGVSGDDTRTHANIWDIMTYPNTNSTSTGTAGDYYCVREGVGFTNWTENNKKMQYVNDFDFKNKSDINNITYLSNMADSDYYSLLALSDIMYLNGDNIDTYFQKAVDATSQETLDALGLTFDDLEFTTKLTESDVKAIQQAVVWYFSNHDLTNDFNNIYDNTSKTDWLYYTVDGNTYSVLSDYDASRSVIGSKIGSGLDRANQANILYRYLISTAKNKAQSYQDGTSKSNTTIRIYTNLNNQEATQPIIALERIPQEVKEFDLSIRKYVTKVDGIALQNSRVPNIDKSTINTVGTATYKHRKDPVVVKTGSTVTYNLTVYNEGEKAGRALEITDQLAQGLKFNKVITNGFTANYDETANKVIITRDSSNTTNLEAYTNNNLNSETIEIECTVTAKPDTTNRKILTNVAWISKEFDSVDSLTITNQIGKDRDSEPSTTPSVNKGNMSGYIGNNTNKTDLTDSTYYYKGQQDDDDFEKLVIEPAAFDLKLIKRIVGVNGQGVTERIENVDITALANGTATTATYTVNKNPVQVKKGDIVKYTFRVYNEGELDGYASEITEDIPNGLEFVWSEKTDAEISADTTLSESEKTAIEQNREALWLVDNVENNVIKTITTDYLAKYRKDANGNLITSVEHTENLIKAFDASKAYKNTINDKNPDYKEVSVYLKVVADDATNTIIRNEAAITEDTDSDGNPIDDRDSSTEEWKKYEDDEDYDNVILQSFDLALRKFIIAVSKDTSIENTEYLKNSQGTYTRAPIVKETEKLNTIGSDGKLITTAVYEHSKEPIEVTKGDIVVYMIRVYNEGDIDGYASEITDYLPPYLQYVESDYNKQYGWTVSENGRKITTTYLKNKKIDKIVPKNDGGYTLDYEEVPIMCKVTDKAQGKITNIAEITEAKDTNNNPVNDRDSNIDNVVLPADKDLPSYKDNETGAYIPGQQDDDDFDKVVVKTFDLALRKFITAVNDGVVTNRIPQVKYDKNNNKITYEHTKDPVDVSIGNIVTYTIRVYNEGELDGYASQLSDDIPEGLEYLPENDLNKEYRWIMYDKERKETEDISKAVKITTDYLSKEQGETRKGTNSENSALLKAFDSSKEISESNPDYADVKVSFKVVETPEIDENKVIINSAQISDDTDKDGNPVDDEDSTPDKWIDGEDDQDKEYIKIKYFDLALRKWVTQAIVIENGKETVTETGHKAEDDPEQVVKVEINRKKLNSVTVKFKYSIRVTNEGDIAGYAKEITDYVPEGLKFVAQDNLDWKDEGNNIISTKKLENTLLQPGESAEVEVILTWINGKDNLGQKVNIAEISEDYNDKDVPDRDSTPDNKVPGEDDQDDAPVILSISTGKGQTYFIIGFTVLVTLASGIVLIKKFML